MINLRYNAVEPSRAVSTNTEMCNSPAVQAFIGSGRFNVGLFAFGEDMKKKRICRKCGKGFAPKGWQKKKSDWICRTCRKTQVNNRYERLASSPPTAGDVKFCPKCKETKPTTEFYNKADTPDGYAYSCGSCCREYMALYKTKNAKKLKLKRQSWYQKNKEKVKHNRREYHKTHKRMRFKYQLKQWGLTIEQYEQMLEFQGGVCGLCGGHEVAYHNLSKTLKRLAVDHDHATGRVRGLLCQSCNVMLGFAKDDIDLLGKAVVYLEKGGCHGRKE